MNKNKIFSLGFFLSTVATQHAHIALVQSTSLISHSPQEALRPLTPAHLASDIHRLKVMSFSKCPLTKNKELFEAIDARQQSIDILQLHGNVRVLTLPVLV